MKEDLMERLQGVYAAIAANIIRLRGKMSQESLGKKAGISRSTIEKLESGKGCNLENLIKIADALGVKPEDLFISAEDRQRVSYMHVKLMDRLAESLDIKKGVT